MFEVYIASFLAGLAGLLLVFGLKITSHRDVNVRRFGAFEYDYQEDEELKQQTRKQIGLLEKIKPAYMSWGTYGLLLLLGSSVGAMIILIISGKPSLTPIGLIVGIAVPRAWLMWQQKTHKTLLLSQVEQAVESMSMVIRSGGSMASALERATRISENPLRAELENTSAEIKLGIEEAVAFKRLANKIMVPEMEMLNIATTLQEQGMAVNMANVLQEIQLSIRARQAFVEEIKVITAENRFGVWLIACVPFATLSIARFFAPDFIDPLFNTPIGIGVFVLSVTMIVVGIAWSFKIANSVEPITPQYRSQRKAE